MADAELVKKMLQEVLQANPAGVSLSRLTAQYKALTQEHIPHRLLGHDQLEGLLASMPSVVRTERPRGGETAYFAAASGETKVAKVVARQRSSKRTGPAHLVNTQMRVKPAVPLILNVRLVIVDVHIPAGVRDGRLARADQQGMKRFAGIENIPNEKCG
ncbi:unnamed protein product [Arctogadus glacialis]